MSHDYDVPAHDCWAVVSTMPRAIVDRLVREQTAAVVMDWVRETHLVISKEESDRLAAETKAKRDALIKRIEDGEHARKQLMRMDGKDV